MKIALVGGLVRLAKLRTLGIDALVLAQKRNLLWFAQIYGFDSWIVTDAERINAQARRMDGQIWEHIDAKAYTLPGSWASWPIGIVEARQYPFIALVEGGPDILAALYFIVIESKEKCCAPVAMLGARQRIHENALPFFAGKRVRIFAHADVDGREAADNWAAQLEPAGAVVDAFNFEGLRKLDESPVKDLNDCTSIHPDDFESERDLWELMP